MAARAPDLFKSLTMLGVAAAPVVSTRPTLDHIVSQEDPR